MEVATVAIFDAGSQYGKLIDRVIRECGVKSEILPFNTTAEELKLKPYVKAIILSGGPESVYSKSAPKFDPNILIGSGLPVLGICYGMQLIAHLGQGKVEHLHVREDGTMEVELDLTSKLFEGLNHRESVLLTHGDSVTDLAPGFRVICRSIKSGLIAGVENPDRKLYGVQFHPEVKLTVNGKKILANFLHLICQFPMDYTVQSREELAIKEIQLVAALQPEKKILCMVSGGVDSTVCTALIRKAIDPKRIVAVHIDTGFMRQGESDLVAKSLKEIGIDLLVFNAQEQFLNGMTLFRGRNIGPLKSTIDSEEKRAIIGDTFIRVADLILREKLGLTINDVLLAQGTLRPDLIESASTMASSKADVIKTHHNDTTLVRELRNKGLVLEPLKDLHKDEVRKLGESLGLPHELIWRHPFPGPALAIRIICQGFNEGDKVAFTESRLKENNEIDRALENNEIDHTSEKKIIEITDPDYLSINGVLLTFFFGGLKSQLKFSESQSKLWNDLETVTREIKSIKSIRVSLLPFKSVGIQGDQRSFKWCLGLTCKGSDQINWSDLKTLATSLPMICHQINRVLFVFDEPLYVYEYSSAPETYLTEENLSTLRHADLIVHQTLLKENLVGNISQMPVILAPCGMDHAVILRPFITDDFMTGIAALPGIHLPENAITEMKDRILNEIPDITRVMYDLTDKPPGTTEFM